MLVHKLTEPAKQGDAATVRGENPVDAYFGNLAHARSVRLGR